VIPGEYFLEGADVVANAGRATVELTVANTADRPIQVGSHFHFFEANRALRFDRAQAFGMRLNIPAGTAVRFEPGDEKRVTLVALGGGRRMFGLNALTEGGTREQALGRLATWQRS
jgi:urease beta subunit